MDFLSKFDINFLYKQDQHILIKIRIADLFGNQIGKSDMCFAGYRIGGHHFFFNCYTREAKFTDKFTFPNLANKW